MQKEFNELPKIILNKNEIHVINDTDKNLGAAIMDKEEVINECKNNCLTLIHTLNYPWENGNVHCKNSNGFGGSCW